MNTPESDMEQMKFAREWVRAHAAKKMVKHEKKLRRAAKDFFGHPVAIAYLKPGAMLEIKDTGYVSSDLARNNVYSILSGYSLSHGLHISFKCIKYACVNRFSYELLRHIFKFLIKFVLYSVPGFDHF